MDPAPFWFWANVSYVVFGDTQGHRRLAVSTTSHYGMEGTVVEGEPILARLRSNGTSFVMPRYAPAGLAERRDGELALIVWSSRPIWWLPCETIHLAENIVSSDYPETIVGDPAYFSDEELESQGDYLKQTPEGIMPRYAIPVSKLSAKLRAKYPSGHLPSCEVER